MAAAAFLAQNGPLELLQEILLHSQSVNDVYSFSIACQHMRNAWLSNNCGPRAAWLVAVGNMPAAEQALIAHRASKDALERERGSSKISKSPLDPSSMSSRHRVPEPDELSAVWTLHDLALALEESISKGMYHMPRDAEDIDVPEPPRRMAEWRAGVHKAFYRSLISGAALAGIYKAIYVAAMERQDLQLSDPRSPPNAERNSFLNSFPVFRYPMQKEHEEAAFEVYGQWLLSELRADTDSRIAMEKRFATSSGRARSCCERQKEEPCPVQLAAGGTHAEAHAVALDLMRQFWACSEVFRALLTSSSHMSEGEPSDSTGGYALVVPFGWFSSWMVRSYPARERIVPNHSLFKVGRPVRVGGEVDVNRWIAGRLFAPAVGLPVNGVWAPPVIYSFFVYFLRKHMNLAFRPDFFLPDHHADRRFDDWASFIRCTSIFALDDVDEREAFYPEWAAKNRFPPNGFLDGGDLLISSETNRS